MKVPLFHGDPSLDSFLAEYWIQRLHGWTNQILIDNSINVLHCKALHFFTFLKGYNEDAGATQDNWPLFKTEFLKAFGRHAKDTFGVSNLNIAQTSAEEVQFYENQVVVVTYECFSALDLPEAFDFAQPRITSNQRWLDLSANPHCQQFV